MIKEKNLIEKFACLGFVSSSGELYLPLDCGIKFINECFKNKIVIIGIDFIHKIDDKVIPVDPTNSMDISNLLHEGLTWDKLLEMSYKTANYVLNEELKRDATQMCTFVLMFEHEYGAE